MYLGQQLIALNGFGTLRAGITYHYLLEDEERRRVVLIGLDSKPACAWLEYVSIDEFVRAKRTNKIQALPIEDCKRMPPWLRSYEKTHFESDLVVRVKTKPKKNSTLNPPATTVETLLDRYKALVENRQAKVRLVRQNYREIFLQDEPEKILNEMARDASPKQKENRFRLWSLTALAFPGNEWCLMPPPGGRGTYERTAAQNRLGRKHLDGSERGFNVTEEMKPKIKEGFRKHKRKGRSLGEIYRKTLKSHFECDVRTFGKRKVHFHPRGEAFPTVGQFRYWCYKLWGKEIVQRVLMGDIEYQNKVQPPIGSYAEGVRNVLEVVHGDVSHSKEHPKSILSNTVLPTLAMCKFVDSLTGKILGVSAGFGGETSLLYKQAIFVMAAPPLKLSKILNARISEEDMPSQLVPQALHHDQGPGGAEDIRVIHSAADLTISHTMSPRYNPRTNSTVESKHAKHPKLAGIPEYKVSSETALQMYRRELFKAIAQNKSADARSRATPDQISRGLRTPDDLFNDYLGRGRVDGIVVPFDDLVKKYLPVIEVTVKDNFLTYKSVRYRSKEFYSTEWGRNIRKYNGARIRGYCLEISTRVIWVVVDGEIIEVDAVDPVQSAKDSNDMTLFEHDRHDFNARVAESHLDADRAASYQWAEDEADKASNQRHREPTTVQGRAKMNRKNARAEAAAMRP